MGNRTFTWGERTYVMGILNITPDSFSGDGLLPSPPAPLPQAGEGGGGWGVGVREARHFLSSSADILDIGGESTRPGSQPVDADEEMRRVLPVIHGIKNKFPEAIISIDTYKANVADAALEAGAQIINDVWGLRGDPELAAVAAQHKVPVILMHNRSKPASIEFRERLGNAYQAAEYQDLIEDVKRDLMDSVAIARAAGIPDEHIILDPGVGFGKTVEQNLELIRRLDEICTLGFPVILGPSRKSFIGYTLNLPPDQRVEGTAAAVAVGITRGADIIRVHDVEAMVRVARMTDALVRQKK
jgi:dihydropteroate synthase